MKGLFYFILGWMYEFFLANEEVLVVLSLCLFVLFAISLGGKQLGSMLDTSQEEIRQSLQNVYVQQQRMLEEEIRMLAHAERLFPLVVEVVAYMLFVMEFSIQKVGESARNEVSAVFDAKLNNLVALSAEVELIRDLKVAELFLTHFMQDTTI